MDKLNIKALRAAAGSSRRGLNSNDKNKKQKAGMKKGNEVIRGISGAHTLVVSRPFGTLGKSNSTLNRNSNTLGKSNTMGKTNGRNTNTSFFKKDDKNKYKSKKW